MTSLFYDVQRTVEKTAARSIFPISGILKILGISRAWYYRQLDPSPIIDRRFNPFEVSDEELRVLQYRYNHPKMSFRLLAYSMIDHDIAYLSPSEVYKILKDYLHLLFRCEFPSFIHFQGMESTHTLIIFSICLKVP